MPPTQLILSGKVAQPPNSRDALFSLLQGADPLDPKAPQGPHPHPTPPGTPGDPQDLGGQGDPKGPKGTQGDPKGPKGTQGRLRRPWGGWAHGALWGYSEAIPNGKPFRVDCYYERKPLRNESRG